MSWPFEPNYKKLKRNPNVSMSRYTTHRGLPVISHRGPLVPEYLDSILLTLDRSLEAHPETATTMSFAILDYSSRQRLTKMPSPPPRTSG